MLHPKHLTTLRAAVIGGHEDVVHVLLEHGAEVHHAPVHVQKGFNSQHILHIALETLNMEILQALLSAGATLDQEEALHPSLLITAVQLGKLTTTKKCPFRVCMVT